MADIYVAPARAGLLVAYETHRPGQFIGHRHAKPEELGTPAVVASAFGGHSYVVAEPPFAKVPDGPYYQRAILDGDLKLIAPEEAARLQAAINEKYAPKAAPIEAPPEPEIDVADAAEEHGQ